MQVEGKELTSYFKYQRMGMEITEGVKRLHWYENKSGESNSENIKTSYFVTMKKKKKKEKKLVLISKCKESELLPANMYNWQSHRENVNNLWGEKGNLYQ